MGNLSTNPMCPCTKIEISLAEADVAAKYELIYEAVLVVMERALPKLVGHKLGIAKTASLHQAVSSRAFGTSFMCSAYARLCRHLDAVDQ